MIIIKHIWKFYIAWNYQDSNFYFWNGEENSLYGKTGRTIENILMNWLNRIQFKWIKPWKQGTTSQWHCLAPQPKMLSSTTLLGTTVQDVSLHDIAWHSDPRCQPLWHCLVPQPKMLSLDIAWHHDPRCQFLRHCSAQRPEILSL